MYLIEVDESGALCIECLRCGLRSYNPNDIKFRYCCRCHVFHDDQQMLELTADR